MIYVRVSFIPVILLSACALSPGQLDPIKVEAHDSCVQVSISGNPVAGQSTATFTPQIPTGGLVGGAGLLASATDTTVPSGVSMTCTVRSDHHDTYPPPSNTIR